MLFIFEIFYTEAYENAEMLLHNVNNFNVMVQEKEELEQMCLVLDVQLQEKFAECEQLKVFAEDAVQFLEVEQDVTSFFFFISN